MYRVEPIFDHQMNVEVSDCMYKIEPIFRLNGAEDECSDVVKLLKRHELVLARLEVLKKEMDTFRPLFENKINRTCKVACVEKAKNGPKLPDREVPHSPTITDLVIRIDPDDVPVSLLILKSFLSSQCKVLCSSLVHSSAGDVAPRLREIFAPQRVLVPDRNGYKYAITFVFGKSGERTPTLTLSPTKDVVIVGEFVIARHLGRLLIPSYESLSASEVALVDQYLDMAASFKVTGKPDVKKILDEMDKKLSNFPWLLGKDISLADVALWSVIYSKKKDFGKLPKNVDRWYNVCKNQSHFANLP